MNGKIPAGSTKLNNTRAAAAAAINYSADQDATPNLMFRGNKSNNKRLAFIVHEVLGDVIGRF